MRAQYDSLLNKCVNFELMTKYNLRGFSSIEYCTAPNLIVPIDWLDLSFVGAVCIWLIIILVSSLYDRFSKKSFNEKEDLELIENHYKTVPDEKCEYYIEN